MGKEKGQGRKANNNHHNNNNSNINNNAINNNVSNNSTVNNNNNNNNNNNKAFTSCQTVNVGSSCNGSATVQLESESGNFTTNATTTTVGGNVTSTHPVLSGTSGSEVNNSAGKMAGVVDLAGQMLVIKNLSDDGLRQQLFPNISWSSGTDDPFLSTGIDTPMTPGMASNGATNCNQYQAIINGHSGGELSTFVFKS